MAVTMSGASISFGSSGPAMTVPLGTAPIYGIRAWANFDGVMAGTYIRNSGNVSSVTDLGVGSYQVNFNTAMLSASYAVVGSCRRGSGDTNTDFSFPLAGTYSTTAVQVRTQSYNNWAALDADIVNVLVIM